MTEIELIPHTEKDQKRLWDKGQHQIYDGKIGTHISPGHPIVCALGGNF